MNKMQVKNLIKMVIISGTLGFLCGFGWFFLNKSVINIESFKNIELKYLIIIPTLIGLLIGVLATSLNKKLKADNYSDDENSVFAQKENYLEILQTTATIFQIINLLAFGVNINFIDLINGIGNIEKLIFVTLLFIINIAILTYLEVFCVNILKKVQPEKNADPTKINYNTKAIDTLDELELKKSGISALKTLADMVKVNSIFLVIGVLTSQKPMYFVALCIPWAISFALNTFHNIKERSSY